MSSCFKLVGKYLYHETLKECCPYFTIRWAPVALPCKITFCFPMQAIDHQSCSCPTRECKLVINHHYLQRQDRRLFTNRNTPTKQRKVKTDGCLKLSLNFINPCAEVHYFRQNSWTQLMHVAKFSQPKKKKQRYLSKQDNAKWPNKSNEEQETDHPAKWRISNIFCSIAGIVWSHELISLPVHSKDVGGGAPYKEYRFSK